MNSLIGHLSELEIKALFKKLNYLNVKELKNICDQFGIPYEIYILVNSTLKKTGSIDRKGIVLSRIKYFLKTQKIKKPTVYTSRVVNFEKLPDPLKASDRVYYGQYKNKNKFIEKLMNQLTQGKFKFGAIAQIVLRDCWSQGKAPSYKEFSKLWLQASADHTKPKEEWAFLTDRHQGLAGKDWKNVRNRQAKEVIQFLKSVKGKAKR